jgi:hypothetical protein
MRIVCNEPNWFDQWEIYENDFLRNRMMMISEENKVHKIVVSQVHLNIFFILLEGLCQI